VPFLYWLLCGCPFCLLPRCVAGRPVIVTVCFRQGFVILCCQVEHAHWQLPTVCRFQLVGSVRLVWVGRLTWVCKPTVGYTPIPQFHNSWTDPIHRNRLSAVGRTANYTFWRRAQCVREGFLGLRLARGRRHRPGSWLSFGLMLTKNDTAICRFHSMPHRDGEACTSLSVYVYTTWAHQAS